MRYFAGLTELCGPAPAHPVRRPFYIVLHGSLSIYIVVPKATKFVATKSVILSTFALLVGL